MESKLIISFDNYPPDRAVLNVLLPTDNGGFRVLKTLLDTEAVAMYELLTNPAATLRVKKDLITAKIKM